MTLRVDVMLADDWLLPSLFEDPQARRGLDWGTIVADHWTPWLFGDWGYFRPSTSLVMAAWMQLFGGLPERWNLLNTALHAFNIGMFVALLRRLDLRVGAMLVASAFLILHPAMVEPVLWFSSVNEVVAVAGTLIACHGVVRQHEGRRGARWWWMLGLWVALTGKENGAVAVLVLPLLDRLLGPRPWRDFARDHLWRTGPVLALAVATRALAGCIFPSALFEGLDNSVSHFVDSMVTKAGLVLLPGAGLPLHVAAGVGAIVVVAAIVAAQSFAWHLVLTSMVLGAYLAFGTYHYIDESYVASRLLYPAVFVAALLVAWLTTCVSRRGVAIPLGLAVLALLVVSARRTAQRGGDFAAAAEASERVITSLLDAYRAEPPTGLLCPIAVPETMHGTLALQSNVLFAIVQYRSSGPNRLLPLTYLTQPVYVSRNEQLHALPLRIAIEEDASLLSLTADGAATVLSAAQTRGPTSPPNDALTPDGRGIVRFPAAVSPLQIETVIVQAPGARAVRLRWMFADGGTAPAGPSNALVDGVARIQVGDDFLLLAALTIGGVTGVQIELDPLDAVAPFESSRVQVSAIPDRLEWISPHDQQRVPRAAFERLLAAPMVDVRPGTHLRMGLLLPSSGVSFEVRPGQPLTPPFDIQKHLDWTLHIAREITAVCWFYERSDGEQATSLGRRTAAARVVVER
ncbi:MAG: hypothetical protein ABIP94_21675 [Planctomycetota bacterium]